MSNYLVMFVGWEGVGVCSYLLVNFWFTRNYANQSSISAFITNRVGDMFLTVGMLAIAWSYGNLDYASVFSLAPFINEDIIVIIGICLLIGAMAKSSQLGLHCWLPLAMEGPSPVSALIHSATMVNCCCCHEIFGVNPIWYHYMLKQLYIKFIYILSYLNKINKKFLCLIVVRINLQGLLCSREDKILYPIRVVNQQEILLSIAARDGLGASCNGKEKSSETRSDITYNFDEYYFLISQHKKKINRQFLEWFIGFTEGDGSFIVSKNKVYFDITQSLSDIQVLYYIKKELGFGKVLVPPPYLSLSKRGREVGGEPCPKAWTSPAPWLVREEEHRNVGVFYVSSKENFSKLIHIFNGNFSTNYKKEQFKAWLNTYNEQYNMNIIFKNQLVKPSLDSSWISGFIDAEGCFYGRVKSCSTSKLRKAPHLTFQVSQKEFDIIKTLRDIFLNTDTLDLKNVRYDKSWDGWTFNCSSFTKLKVVRNYLYRYELKTKKSLSFTK